MKVAVDPPPRTLNPPSVQQQLSMVADALKVGIAQPPMDTTTTTAPKTTGADGIPQPSNAPDTKMFVVTAGAEPTRAKILEEIKQIESSIAPLVGDYMVELRAPLEAQLAARRKVLQGLKPLGKRLDDTRAALERAKKRRGLAEEAMRLAKVALEQANTEEAKLEGELKTLEASVAPETETDAVKQLGESLANALDQLRNISTLSPEVTKDAQEQSDALISKFAATIGAAEAAVADAKKRMSLRMVGKQPGPPAVIELQQPVTPLITHTLVGKHPVQSNLTSFFGPMKPKSGQNPRVSPFGPPSEPTRS